MIKKISPTTRNTFPDSRPWFNGTQFVPVVSAAGHCPHHHLLKQPAGLLPQFQLPAQLGVFACGHIVNIVESL